MGTPRRRPCGRSGSRAGRRRSSRCCPECRKSGSRSGRRRQAGSGRVRASDGSAPADPRPHALTPAWPERALPGDGDLAARVADSGDAAVRRRPSARLPRPSRLRAPGKTTFALTVAAELLGRRIVDRVTIVAPTEHLAAVGRRRRPAPACRSTRRTPPAREDVAGLRRHRGDLRRRGSTCSRCGSAPSGSRPLVISTRCTTPGMRCRGEGIREAFEPITRRLALTGTPFRLTSTRPAVSYAPGDDGVPRSVADFTYGYAHALADHVVRRCCSWPIRRDAVAHPRADEIAGPAW